MGLPPFIKYWNIRCDFSGEHYMYAAYRYGRYKNLKDFGKQKNEHPKAETQRLYPTKIGSFELSFIDAQKGSVFTPTEVGIYNATMNKTYVIPFAAWQANFVPAIPNYNSIWQSINETV